MLCHGGGAARSARASERELCPSSERSESLAPGQATIALWLAKYERRPIVMPDYKLWCQVLFYIGLYIDIIGVYVNTKNITFLLGSAQCEKYTIVLESLTPQRYRSLSKLKAKLESVQLRRHCNSKATPISRQSIWHIISICWIFFVRKYCVLGSSAWQPQMVAPRSLSTIN